MPAHQVSSRRFMPAAAMAAAVSFMVSGAAASDPGDFYVRAGFSLERSSSTRFMDRDCSTPRPGHFYGCMTDGDPHGSRGDFGTMHGFRLGVGFFASPVVRLEADVQYHPSFSFEGHHSYRSTPPRSTSANLSSLAAMLSGYLDLPRFGVSRLGPVRPFVGGGVGLSRIVIDVTQLHFPSTVAKLPRGYRTNLAWMATTGVSISRSESLTLDIAWRYTYSGRVETGRGTGRTVCRTAGCGLDSDYAVPETRAKLSSHGLHLSVRRTF